MWVRGIAFFLFASRFVTLLMLLLPFTLLFVFLSLLSQLSLLSSFLPLACCLLALLPFSLFIYLNTLPMFFSVFLHLLQHSLRQEVSSRCLIDIVFSVCNVRDFGALPRYYTHVCDDLYTLMCGLCIHRSVVDIL